MLDQKLRVEHSKLARGFADLLLVTNALPELTEAQRVRLIRAAVALLRRFERHARAEERDVYPTVTKLLGDRRLEAAMTHDHRALESGVAELARIDPFDSPRLAALLYGLHALLTAHMQKEEQIVFPLLETSA